MIDYRARRHALAKRLPKDAIAIIPAASEQLRNGDNFYRFRQDSDFYYLTGFNESDAVLLITGGAHSESILFNRPNNPDEARWVGPRLGDAAKPILGIDTLFAYDTFQKRLPELLLNRASVYYPMGRNNQYELIIRDAFCAAKQHKSRLQTLPHMFVDSTPVLGEMRLIKNDAEIQLMRDAASLSIAAHEKVMRACSKASNEYELEAEFVYALGRAGCREMAYSPIVAGGARACTLHYTANNQPLRAGELLLIDAGAEVSHYAADITRTYPIHGVFSTEQRLIYDLVWHAQKAGMACVKPGAAWDSIQTAVVFELTSGLIELGLLKGDVETLIAEGAYRAFYMHTAGHWLGLDVHDVGAYHLDGSSRLLEPGMVLTVEPGIYIAEDQTDVPEKWRGIGVRIEDNLHVTVDGYEHLTGALLADPDDLMRFVKG